MAKKGPQQPHTNDHANGDVNGIAASECLEADEISRMENAAVRCVLELAPSARSVAVAQALERNSHVQQAVKVQLASISFAEQMRARIRSVLLLSLLLITVPFSLGGIILLGPLRCFSMVLAAARELGTRWLQESQPQNTRNSRTAVVTGAHMTKGLHVCRQLRRAGWRVVAVDYDKWWMGMSRFSTSVAAFHTVPDPGRDSLGYMQAVAEVCRQEGASLLIPSAPPNHSIYDAILIDLLPSGCRSLSLSADLTAVLDDKIKFSEVCNKIGVRVPKMWSITTHDELRKLNVSSDVTNGGARFLLKCVSYDPKHRTDLFTLPATAAALEAYLKSVDISLNCPWILQQYLTGREYSCYTVADEGRIVAHSDNIASLSCLNFGHVDSREIAEWMETFCSKLKLTGQVCVDFMEDSKDGHLYSIECNPRCSTVLCAYHDSSQLGLAFTEPSAISSAVKPRSDSPPLYWFWNEVYSLSRTWELKAFFSNITGGVDAVYDSMDPLPFLALHHLQAPVLLLRNLVTGTPWTKLDLCIGKLSELGGD